MIYLFHKKESSYVQYPIDNTEKFLRRFCEESSCEHQIVVHRDGNLMYYAYLRKKAKSVIGLCVVANSKICTDFEALFVFFQTVMDDAAHKGTLLSFDTSGNVVLNTRDFASVNGEIEQLFKDMEAELNQRQFWGLLPVEDWSIARGSSVALSIDEDGNNKIVEATRHYTNVHVTFENVCPTSYAQTVKRLNQRVGELEKKNEKLTQQKKQYRTILILILLLVASGLILVSVIKDKNYNMGILNSQVASLHDTISQMNSEIDALNANVWRQDSTIINLNGKIDSLIKSNKDLCGVLAAKNDSISYLNSLIEQLRKKNDDLERERGYLREENRSLERQNSTLKANQAILTIESIDVANVYKNGNIETDYGGTIYSSRTMYLKPRIKYTASRDERVTLNVRLYDNNGNQHSYENTLNLTRGSGRYNLSGWGNDIKGNWKAGSYRYEIWYNGTCLKEKTFKIY